MLWAEEDIHALPDGLSSCHGLAIIAVSCGMAIVAVFGIAILLGVIN